jgi:hypothetical protein
MEKVVCPKCREDTPVVDADVSKIFCNFQLLEAANAIKAHAAAESDVSCELCDEQHAATHRCVQCTEFMCQTAATVHGKMRATRDHAIQTIAEFTAGGPGVIVSNAATRTVYCATHASPSVLHELTLFCKTCDIAICRDCIIKDHKQPDHDVVFLEEVIEDQRGVMTAMVADAEQRAGVVGEAIESISAMQQSVVEREAESEGAIKRTCQQVCAAARAHEAKMLVTLKGGVAQKKKELGVQAEALSTFKAGLDSSCEYVRTALRDGSDQQVMHAKPLLLGRLRELQQQECVLAPAATEHIWLNTDTSPVMSALGDVCVPHFPTVVVERCTVEGAGVQGRPVVGKEAEFTVALNDGDGERVVLPAGGSHVLVAEANVGRCADVIKVSVASNGDGSFACKYTPVDKSALHISVLVLGKHVPGSPFDVQPALVPRGVVQDQPMSILDGWTSCMDEPYSYTLTMAHLDSVVPAKVSHVFVGAVKDGRIVLGAFGARSEVMKRTSSTTVAHQDNGVWWYFYNDKSFGFSPVEAIKLNGADTCEVRVAERLSWHVTAAGSTGYRAGVNKGLSSSGDGGDAYRKVIYTADE